MNAQILMCMLGLATASFAAPALAQPAPSTSDAPPAAPAPARDDLTDARVVDAIHKGVAFLLKDIDPLLAKAAKGLKEGGAEIRPNAVPEALGPEGGDLMLAAYALFAVGQEFRTPELNLRDQRIAALKEVVVGWTPPAVYGSDTYTTALQALALSQLPRLPEVEAAMKRASSRLVAGMNATGGYSYSLSQADDPDNSNSQYGLLGVWAAAEWGVQVPQTYWQISNAYWRRTQAVNGGWGYRSDRNTSANMTAAGLASLYVCAEYAAGVMPLAAAGDGAIDRGLAALTSTFNPANTDLYYLYALERVSLAGGHKYLGKHDWYRETTRSLLKQQQPDGSFDSQFMGTSPGRASAFAVLHLLRGRAPILMNKLQYDGAWNLRPRDSANVHSALSRTFERRLNWQVVTMDSPAVEWLDAPILYLSGTLDPEFTDQQVEKLRTYVHSGGMIFSLSARGSSPFSEAMERYARRIAAPPGTPTGPAAPAPRSGTLGWRELLPAHPLFKVSEVPESLPSLKGLSNGVRELWVHCDTDLSAQWQNKVDRKASWDVPARLFLYAAGKDGLQSRLHTTGLPEPLVPPSDSVAMVRLQFRGNWNPEPGAWPRMAKLLAADAGTALAVREMPVEGLAGLPAERRPPLAHLAGTGPLVLSESGQQALRSYVQAGGTLLIEAIGGDPTFARSARELLPRIFPDAHLRTVPSDYLLYTGSFSPNAVRIREVEYRRPPAAAASGRDPKPRVEYLTIGNRTAVLFSDQDLTHGLLGYDTAGITGYTPASAQAIARNVLLFSVINQKK